MGRLYVPSKTLTPLDRVREALDEAERAFSNLRGAGPQAIRMLHLFDQIARDLGALDQESVEVRVERSRFEMIQAQLRRRKRRFLNEIGDDLKPARQEVAPERSSWWWYLDEEAAKQLRRTLLRAGALTTAVIALLAVAYVAYQRFLAPPPSVGQAFRHMQAGERLVEEGDAGAAIEDFRAAADLTPEDPEPWLWQGVLYEGLNEPDRAQNAFAVAQSLFDEPLHFYLNRGRIYLEAGQVDKAENDARRAIAADPASGWSYYLRAGIAVRRGDYDSALADLDRATDLAQAAGDTQLAAMARTQQVQVMRLVPLQEPTP